ncbi:MAG: two-component sensor histidine kinase [Planctomycetaceae bacterium]|nr:two-component sensor histidine kinase [Planctomycetaceae bacterium]
MAVTAEFDEQERARLLKQYSEIATLAGGLAHEIRNPLSTIRLNLNLLSEEVEQGESARDRRMLNKLLTLQRECKHLEDILDAFLQFARVGELRLHPADLNTVVKQFVSFAQAELSEHGIELSPHLDPDLPMVQLDETLMHQVLMNLVRNARQAMPDGGLLEIQTYERDGRVCLDIIDNGIGMDERTRSRMFKAFFSTRSGGSGLGLPTVRKIIEAHHGTIECESEPGQGTRFSISLPNALIIADSNQDDDSEE